MCAKNKADQCGGLNMEKSSTILTTYYIHILYDQIMVLVFNSQIGPLQNKP